MAGLILVRPGADWTATGGLFDWTLEFLIDRLSDEEAVQRLRDIVDNNLGSLWISEFPSSVQAEIFRCWQQGLIDAAERELPESTGKAEALSRLRELVDLAAGSAGG